MISRPTFLFFGIAMMALSACAKNNRGGAETNALVSTPQSLMVNVAKQIQACWFRNKDPVLAPYRMAAELNSYSGKPRILIVPRKNPGGLPKLVALAERMSGRTRFSSFGPLLTTSDGPRLQASLRSWANGSKAC